MKGLSCQFTNCSHTCQETPKGGKCICSHGYKIAQDGKTCKDIDECKDENECAQFCKNLDGSFSCSCLSSDYILRADKSSCKALGMYNFYLVFIVKRYGLKINNYLFCIHF